MNIKIKDLTSIFFLVVGGVANLTIQNPPRINVY